MRWMKPQKICSDLSSRGAKPVPPSNLQAGRRSNGKSGSLLLEALLSVVVMSIGLTAVMQTLTASYKLALLNKDYLQAIFLADDQMSALVSNNAPVQETSESQSYPEPNDRFHYELSETPSEFSEGKLLREVNLKISWVTGHQKNELPVTTLLFVPPDDKK